MTSLPEQLSAASTRQISAQLDAQFRFFNTLATQALDSASRLVSLNLSASRDSIERSSNTLRQLAQATQPRDLAVLRNHTEDQVRSLFNYGRELFNITANAQPYGLRTIAPTVTPAALAAPVLEQAVKATEEAVQETTAAVARAADTVSDTAAKAVAEAAAPVVQAPVAEPLVVQQDEAPVVAAEALAQVGEEAEPVAKQKQIAKAASGKGASKAGVASQPLAAPIEDQEAASIARIEPPSKRRK